MPNPTPKIPLPPVQPSWVPERKWLAGGTAGIITWGLSIAVRHYFGVTIDGYAAELLVGAVGGLVSWATPPSAKDILRRLNDGIVEFAMNDPKIPVTKK